MSGLQTRGEAMSPSAVRRVLPTRAGTSVENLSVERVGPMLLVPGVFTIHRLYTAKCLVVADWLAASDADRGCRHCAAME